MTHVDDGAAVLTNEGALYIIELIRDLKHETLKAGVKENIMIDPQFCSVPNI